MIDNLTPEQEEQLIKHREEYLALGLSCEPLDKVAACAVISEMYTRIGKPIPEFEICQSPFHAIQTINSFKQRDKDIANNLGGNLWSNLTSNLWSNLRSNLKNDYIGTNFWGQQDMYWIAFYRYPEKYLGIKYSEEDSKILSLWDTLGRSCDWWYPYEKMCFISDRPQEIHKKGIQLHNESGPALLYRDGYALWMLNGVDVGEKIVTTPGEKLDVSLILTEKNAEVRRELVRKIGIELVCQRLGAKCVDKVGDYELLMLDLGDGRVRPYLKMLNPSIGVYHIEGVSPGCDSVRKALTWRNQTEEDPVILT